MLALRSIFYFLLSLPIKLLVRCKIVPDNLAEIEGADAKQPIFYIVRHQSASDLLSLQKACKALDLPDPLSQVVINGQSFDRTLCLEKPTSIILGRRNSKTKAFIQGIKLLKLHNQDKTLDAKLIPANLIWGRRPTVEKNNANMGTVLADQESPTPLRKFFIVLFLGRHTLVRFSDALSLRVMADDHGADQATARKLLRVARFHFHRQTIAATGPRLMHRQQMFTALFANPSIKRLIADEVKSKKLSEEKVKKQALAIMDEIAGDYRESMIRLGERALNWLWNRLYKGIEVNNANKLREVAQDGHEIIYVPCHRSHMDYLLLTYVIFHEGLVTPRIAAGINLNFWPAGPIFRKAGAFFIRRSFRGNRMYSTIFREYLGLLFERGYSVKYYTEGGRSRTGRILQPKTGMIAMTIQSLLRGIDRPLTLVPVYIGYEHVMEVGSYHKELSGSKKQKESIFGVLKAIKSLRNYGKGYVNFGEPININQFLNQNVENWKDAIDPIDPQKPSWLTPAVNVLANDVMKSVNQSVALNSVSLAALILLATENKALAESELNAQMAFFLNLQKHAPYSDNMTMPEDDVDALVEHIKSLGKVNVEQDNFGTILSLSDTAALEMRYYRNNILHAYMLPAFVCRILERNAKVNHQELIGHVQQLIALVKNEMFLWQSDDDVAMQVEQVLNALVEFQMVKQSKAGFWSVVEDMSVKAKLREMGECVDETLQRLAIITTLLSRLAPISKSALEEQVIAIAKRLSKLNNINAPEFVDKKAQSALINVFKELGYAATDEQNYLNDTAQLSNLKALVNNLVDIEVLQSIAR
ncbi:glycerol-3-phosphate 1-O-acyltransferase PlsB [Thalassotalea sp. M1531]|uniref:Glycerol-3-phosphate acyltransferase n=1 Tax=Thalassotalea algicola TaxID=2716224 RepID=A0A7Y0LG92_9GAMM|nr:glycerol-3-phosphate 1-O-acyltransferase PlsB [Thalassotalea algicola]NMP33076.1 glycerol-3-phosphate 1-O-acyltransferase PlsB [Thalassotalea algicola]